MKHSRHQEQTVISVSVVDRLDELQNRIGVHFRNLALLRQALRHDSAAIEDRLLSNERLEFLGDAILGAAVCEWIYNDFPTSNEGNLAKAKAFLVSEVAIAEAALSLGIDAAMEMGAPEEATGGRERKSMLADAFEAVVAAIFLDQGYDAARSFVRSALADALGKVERHEYNRDYKSMLQERTQGPLRTVPEYIISREVGAQHDKTFTAEVHVAGTVAGVGVGKSKKQAEQAAAKAAIGSGILDDLEARLVAGECKASDQENHG